MQQFGEILIKNIRKTMRKYEGKRICSCWWITLIVSVSVSESVRAILPFHGAISMYMCRYVCVCERVSCMESSGTPAGTPASASQTIWRPTSLARMRATSSVVGAGKTVNACFSHVSVHICERLARNVHVKSQWRRTKNKNPAPCNQHPAFARVSTGT